MTSRIYSSSTRAAKLVLFLSVILALSGSFAFKASNVHRKYVDVAPFKSENFILQESRRKVLKSGVQGAAAILGINSIIENANGLQQEYPDELQLVQENADIETLRKEYISRKKRELEEKKTFKNFVNGFGENDSSSAKKSSKNMNTLASIVWAGAIWLLSGSRQNILVNPMVGTS